jgi:hypothetical protein
MPRKIIYSNVISALVSIRSEAVGNLRILKTIKGLNSRTKTTPPAPFLAKRGTEGELLVI